MSDVGHRPGLATARTATGLRWRQGLTFFTGVAAVQVSLEYISQYGTYFLAPPADAGRPAFVSLGLVGVAFAVARLLDAISDPLVGVWSDRHVARPGRFPWIAGRRRPFLFWASFPLLATSVLFWHPPVAEPGLANFIHCLVSLTLQLFFLTCCAIPLYALGPDLARSSAERIALGAWTGVGTTLGVMVAIVVAGPLVAMLDPARATGSVSATGFQRVAWLLALAAFMAFQGLVWAAREPSAECSGGPADGIWKDVGQAVRQPRFVWYFAIFLLFNVGFLTPQRCVPHWVEIGLGGDETTVGLVLWPFFATSLVASLIAPAAARILGAKWLMVLGMALVTVSLPWMYPIAAAVAPTARKVGWGQVMFAVAGLGNGLLYAVVLPILGDIIDDDARGRPGRREALFLALHTMTWKAGVTVSVVLATQVLERLGASAAAPGGILWVGPVSAAVCCPALALAVFYPTGRRKKADCASL